MPKVRVIPHMIEPAPAPDYLGQRRSLGSRAHLETVFMSRLQVKGLPTPTRGLVKRILHHGFQDGHKIEGLYLALGKHQRSIRRHLTKHNLPPPKRWLKVCRLLYVIWIYFRLRGSFKEAVKHLGCGKPAELSTLCESITGIRPTEAHRECLEANSILPFIDRCILHLLPADMVKAHTRL